MHTGSLPGVEPPPPTGLRDAARALYACNTGGVAERFKAAVLKTAGRASVPWVRIPPPPPPAA